MTPSNTARERECLNDVDKKKKKIRKKTLVSNNSEFAYPPGAAYTYM